MMLLFLLSLFLFSSTVQGKDYTVVVKTSDASWAGTDATVKIRIRGTTNYRIERALPGDRKYFEQGDTDTFHIQDYDVGRVKELDVYRDDSGILPKWKLDWIKIKSDGVPDSIFKYYDWVSKEVWTSLRLSCSHGYEVNSQGYCDVKDVDECLVNNPCISPANCINTVGSYACDCPNGYEQKSKNECQDKNECTQNPCNYVTSDCKNFAGGFRCDCKPGYKNVNPTTCQNVNECSNNTHSCNPTSSSCVDSDGSYWCDCKPGYTRGINNKICEANSCGSIAGPAGSILEPARCTKVNANVYGDRCVMKCQVGYVISDVSHGILTCGSSGRWEGTMGRCNVVTCPKLAPISNGDLLPSTCKSIGGNYRHTCSYYCHDGYQIVGTSRRECQADGTWDEAVPTCKKVIAKPWIRCPDLISQDLLPGKSTADVSSVWKEPTSNVQQITISPPEISSSYQFPVGSTKVTWTASNEMGSESCSIYVIIYDKENPNVTYCPQDIHQISNGPKVVTWVKPTFSDNVKVTREVNSIASGSTFQLGSTYVTYTAYDAAGNSVQCRFKVELKRAPCHDPDGPVGGTKSCNQFGNNKFCQTTCPSGSQLYKGSGLFWSCTNGEWSPSDHIPDCVEAVRKDANTVCQENQIEMTVASFQGALLYCGKCPTGMHKSSSTDCSPCPAGTYNNQQGQLQCTLKCPTGTSTVPGAKSANDCKPKCSAGQFSNTGLAPNCQYCQRDTYQDNEQQTNCMPCPNGTTTLSLGADSLSKCGARPVVTKIDPKIANINEGEDVSVDCYASGIPTPIYTWEFLKKNIPPAFLGKMSQSSIRNAKGEVIGAKLSITGAKYENTGSYECKVTNSHGEATDLAQINVAKVFDFEGSGADEPL